MNYPNRPFTILWMILLASTSSSSLFASEFEPPFLLDTTQELTDTAQDDEVAKENKESSLPSSSARQESRETTPEDEIRPENTPDNEDADSPAFPGHDESLDPKPEEPFFSFLDAPQKTIASGFGILARSIDEFFANESASYESSGSYLRYTADFIWSEGGDFSSQGDLKIRGKFPLTEKKLKLVIDSDPDEKREEIDQVRDSPSGENIEDKSIYAGVQAELGDENKWRFKPSLGIKIRSPIDYYVRFRASRKYQISKYWELGLAETLYWFDSTGYGADTNIDFDRPITENVIFRAASSFRYTEENMYWNLSEVFSITHKLSENRIISYQAGVFAIDEPTVHATDYLLLIRYRQNLHSDYLFAEIAPQVLYQEENDFRAEHSILFRLEIFFRD